MSRRWETGAPPDGRVQAGAGGQAGGWPGGGVIELRRGDRSPAGCRGGPPSACVRWRRRFGSVANIFQAGAEELRACLGIGPTKAKRLFET
jgi:hypothetical protein